MNEYPDWLKAIFPYEQKRVVVNGRAMSYVDVGPTDAQPILLLPGNPTWGFLYREFFGPLTEAGFRVVSPDWVGSGYSDHPRLDASLTFAHHIADLVALLDALDLRDFIVVGQDWGGPQGIGAALQRRADVAGMVLMSTWAFTGTVSRFHASPRPWMTWQAPLIGQYFMKRHQVLSQHGPSAITKRGMSQVEARAYHHVYDEPDSDNVVLTWPRTIPMEEHDRGWDDMKLVEAGLPALSDVPTLLLYGDSDSVFGKPAADRLKELLPNAEGPFEVASADHFMQDDAGPVIAGLISEFAVRSCFCKTPAGEQTARPANAAIRNEGWSMDLSTELPAVAPTLRPDPLLLEQELDFRPAVAVALENELGVRAGRAYWTSAHGHLYCLELGDIGHGRPSTGTVFGFWDRWEPRPPEVEIDADLFDFCLWLADLAPGIERTDVQRVAARAGIEAAQTSD